MFPSEWSDSGGSSSSYVPKPDVSVQERIRAKKEELEKLHQKIDDRKKLLDDVDSFWRKRSEAVRHTISAKKGICEDLREQLQLLQYEREFWLPTPGPACLRFVDSASFLPLVSAVIVLDVAISVAMWRDPLQTKELAVVKLVCLCFYVLELVLKALLHQQSLLFASWKVVRWNWLDVTVVSAAIVDSLLLPWLFHVGSLFHGNLQIVRVMRLFRGFGMLLKYLQSDLSWTEGPKFQAAVLSCVLFNSVLLWLESDFPNFSGWIYLEQLLQAVFTMELSLRLRHQGWSFFCHRFESGWNWLDFIIVVGGIVDLWILPLFHLVLRFVGLPDSYILDNFSKTLMLMRMARLFRLLRIARLVRSVPELHKLVTGIVHSLQGMTWVMLLTVVLLYSSAILGVLLIGHGLVFGKHIPKDAQQAFPNVPEAMFTLFELMNGDVGPFAVIFDDLPISKLWCALFIVLANWAMLAILTAVVSEKLISTSKTSDASTLEEEQREEKQSTEAVLKKIFSRLNSKRDGAEPRELTLREFEEKILQSEVNRALLWSAARLPERQDESHGGDYEERYLRDLFRLVSKASPHSIDPVISEDDFISCLQQHGEEVSQRSIMRMEQRLDSLEDTISVAFGVSLRNRDKE